MNKLICVVKIIQGGAVAAPIASQVLGEVLPYLEVKKQEEEKAYVEMPDVLNMTFSEAEILLKELGLEIGIPEEVNKDSIVTEQVPKKGIKIEVGTKVILQSTKKDETNIQY